MKSSRNDVVYRALCEEEIALPLFSDFSRRQVVNFCLRRTDGVWREEAAPFVDDWNLEDYRFLVACLRRTIQKGGVVYGAFADGALKGFVSVEAEPLGKMGNYRDLTSIHVSEEARRKGIGKKLFLLAKAWAAKQGAEKLYISSHPAAESQAFYLAMGCRDAEEIIAEHVKREPLDRQLECDVGAEGER